MSQSSTTNAQVAQIELSITIPVSLEESWRIFTTEIDAWWHTDFYATSNHLRIVLEPIVGGRLYEDTGNGSGLLWYTVISIDPPHTITLSGNLAPPYGGPALSLLYIRFEPIDEKNTVMHIVDSIIGTVGEYDLREGWRVLFEDGFKRYIEKNSKK